MEVLIKKFGPILFSHLVAGALMWFAKNRTTLPKKGHFGIYLVIVPVGFRQFGADLPNWMISTWVLAGMVLILWSLRLNERRVAVEPSGGQPTS